MYYATPPARSRVMGAFDRAGTPPGTPAFAETPRTACWLRFPTNRREQIARARGFWGSEDGLWRRNVLFLHLSSHM